MAKKRRVKRKPSESTTASQASTADSESPASVATTSEQSSRSSSRNEESLLSGIEPLTYATAMLAGALVYVTYHPSDSVAVEKGDALWFGVIALLIATVTCGRWFWAVGQPTHSKIGSQSRHWPDVIAWSLAGWMMLAAFCTCPPGNLRAATNEAWLWISGAAIFTASRVLLVPIQTRRAMVALIIACGLGLSVHGLHQQWVSLPKNQAEYQKNPDELLMQAGIVAPEGSAERMVFENRLFDGGPTGTFALANSLAGVLVVACIACAGVLRLRWRRSPNWSMAGAAFVLAVCLLCLWYARSRSAMAGCVLGIVAVAILGSLIRPFGESTNSDETDAAADGAGTQKQRSWLQVAAIGLGCLFLAGSVVTSLIAAVGKREWFEQAPASIAFRFQYWRSTFRMALDHPVFGCGPGNFQSIYERYREPSASEQIADPHNWLIETLASGGFVGLFLLIGLVVVSGWLAIRVWNENTDAENVDVESEEMQLSSFAGRLEGESTAKWVGLGGGSALLLVWLIGVGSGIVPDFDAHVLAVPLAIAGSVIVWVGIRESTSAELSLIAITSVVGLMVHLLAAGGWTVPGVAIEVWLLCAMLTRCSEPRPSLPDQEGVLASVPNRRVAFAVIIGGVVLLAGLRVISLGPVESTKLEIVHVQNAQRARKPGEMKAALKRAMNGDTWSPDASMYAAEVLHWEVVLSKVDRSSAREEWGTTLSQALDRAGENPAIYRAAAIQCLHVYQRWGQPDDLALAQSMLEKANYWSPANEWIAAQLAAVYQHQGPAESSNALKMAQKALLLSSLGNNIQRSLSRQLICQVDKIGASVNSGPRLVPAAELLSNQLDKIDVSEQN